MVDDVEIKIRTQRVLNFVKNSLTARERRIITMRYGLGGKKPLTQRETAEYLGISRSYVSRLEKSAIEKLRGEFEKQ